MDKALIQINNISKTFGLERALDSVSLSVKKGEFCVIFGHSGSGKTTLLNCIAGLDSPDSGSLIVNQVLLSNLKEKELFAYRRNKVSYIFQAFNLLPELTAMENVSLFSDSYLAMSAINSVGLKGNENKFPSQLSGGQQQRVSIARALAKKSEIILADEPTGSLDYETGRQVLKMLISLTRTEGKTLILVTHTQEIGKLADHVITLKNGKVISDVFNSCVLNVEDIQW